jgi:hypothetical protein
VNAHLSPAVAILVFASAPAFADDHELYVAASAGLGAATIDGDPFARSRGHLRVESGGRLDATLAISLSSRIGFPPDHDLVRMGAPSGMVRVHRVWTSGLRVHAGVGAGFFGHRVIDRMTEPRLTGPLLLGAGTGYAVRIGAAVRLVVELDTVAAIATGDEIGGIPIDHGLHVEVDVGLALVR